MEQYQQPSEQSIFSLNIDSYSRQYLFEAARWAKFLSIVGFIICGLIALAGIFAGSMLSSFSSRYGGGNDMGMMRSFGGLAIVFYLLVAVLYFFPCLYLYRFSNRMRTALASESQSELNASFENLKSLFKFVGIMTIIILSIYVLIFLFAALAMGSR